jgi:gamma-glutamyltranspeptidase / glutathione hydrolase
VNGAVTASTQEAADAGVRILRAGGNAMDGAIAAALATCVADPSNTGLGGYGGYILVQRSGGPARCIQFPLCAPSNLSPETLARAYPDSGPACTSVPNVLGGLARALRGFGTLPWAHLAQPAIELAHAGVVANAATRRALALTRDAPFITECFVLDEQPSSTAARVTFRQPALAATLETLADRGPEWFYEGPIARAAQRASRDRGIDIPLDDWIRQQETVELVDAPVLACGSVRIAAAPLGLSGSACLFAMLTAASRVSQRMPLDDEAAMADLASAMSSIWQYRSAMPAGNDFSRVDPNEWVNAALAFNLAQPVPPDRSHTAHLNAVDRDGMIVAMTFTHGPALFGGRWAVPGTGVIMNGGMHNFTRPVVVNRHGRWLGVSNMTPTIATCADGSRVAIGCPGARRIPANIAVALAWHCLAGRGLQEAVSAGRLHAEDRASVSCESGRLGDVRTAALRARFPAVEDETGENYFGPLTAIRYGSSGLELGLDDRMFRGFGARA